MTCSPSNPPVHVVKKEDISPCTEPIVFTFRERAAKRLMMERKSYRAHRRIVRYSVWADASRCSVVVMSSWFCVKYSTSLALVSARMGIGVSSTIPSSERQRESAT